MDQPTQWIYSFGNGQAEAGNDLKPLVGGKGASLAEMTRAGLNVPPGFTISTVACQLFYQHQQTWPEGLLDQIRSGLERLEQISGRTFGKGARPLLVAVRSGAAQSMPGMMDTILNVGLNDRTTAALAAESGDERFAFDSYRRFVQMYGDVVLGVHAHDFERRLEQAKRVRGVQEDTELPAEDLRRL